MITDKQFLDIKLGDILTLIPIYDQTWGRVKVIGTAEYVGDWILAVVYEEGYSFKLGFVGGWEQSEIIGINDPPRLPIGFTNEEKLIAALESNPDDPLEN